MELLTPAPAVQNHILELSPSFDGHLNEEKLRGVDALADLKQQQLRLRAEMRAASLILLGRTRTAGAQ